jgi:pimeloyl-ACP methyl ester carboxylesterase
MHRTLDVEIPQTSQPIATREVRGGGGLRLHVEEWGDAQGSPIVFLHGWSQSHLCWSRQVTGRLAEEFRIVTFDLRGHGMSDKPLDAAHYRDGRLWADDLAAVIEDAELDRPVLVAWSYGGFVVTDYVRAYGDDAIAGINLVGGAVMRTPGFDHIGPGLLENAGDACGPDLQTNIAAITRFLRAGTTQPLSVDDWNAALCWNMVVSPEVRAALLAREIDGDDVLSHLSVPVLVTHGRADAIVLPSMAEHVLEVCPTARASWYDGIGHTPFAENPDRFDRELRDFARVARRPGSRSRGGGASMNDARTQVASLTIVESRSRAADSGSWEGR